MRRAVVLPGGALLAVGLLLTGCSSMPPNSGGDLASPSPGACAECDEPAEQAAASPTEGPVAQPHRWPDGVTAQVVAVTPAPAGVGGAPHDPTLDARLLVTVRFTNEGSRTLTWSGGAATAECTLFYGRNRYPAEESPEGGRLPTRLLPGTSAQWTTINFLPSPDTGTLAVQLAPVRNDPAYPPWTFTGAERLVHR